MFPMQEHTAADLEIQTLYAVSPTWFFTEKKIAEPWDAHTLMSASHSTIYGATIVPVGWHWRDTCHSRGLYLYLGTEINKDKIV